MHHVHLLALVLRDGERDIRAAGGEDGRARGSGRVREPSWQAAEVDVDGVEVILAHEHQEVPVQRGPPEVPLRPRAVRPRHRRGDDFVGVLARRLRGLDEVGRRRPDGAPSGSTKRATFHDTAARMTLGRLRREVPPTREEARVPVSGPEPEARSRRHAARRRGGTHVRARGTGASGSDERGAPRCIIAFRF